MRGKDAHSTPREVSPIPRIDSRGDCGAEWRSTEKEQHPQEDTHIRTYAHITRIHLLPPSHTLQKARTVTGARIYFLHPSLRSHGVLPQHSRLLPQSHHPRIKLHSRPFFPTSAMRQLEDHPRRSQQRQLCPELRRCLIVFHWRSRVLGRSRLAGNGEQSFGGLGRR